MTAGDVKNPDLVQFFSNERLDLVDAAYLAKQVAYYVDSLSKANLFTPRASAGLPTGLVLTGGVVLVNPTNPTDGKLRLPTDLLVAIDADGRFVIKEEGTQIDVNVPATATYNQVYLYRVENGTQQAKRRAISVTSPFTESTVTPFTRLRGGVGIYVRQGGLGSILPSDSVNGIDTALVFLGLALNNAGVVTFISSSSTNKLATVAAPTSVPSSSSENGSMRTLHDVVVAALYELARAKFGDQGGLLGTTASFSTGATVSGQVRISGLTGMNAAIVGRFVTISGASSSANNGTFPIMKYVSASTIDIWNADAVIADANNGAISWSILAHDVPRSTAPPSSGNNYGAYTDPRRALDDVDRASPGLVTIGDGASSFGTLDLTDFASPDLCLQAAFNAVIAQGGGTVFVKPGVRLDGFLGDVTIDNSSLHDVVLEGATSRLEQVVETSSPSVTLDGWKIVKTGTGELRVKNLSFESVDTMFNVQGRFVVEKCTFDIASASGGGAAIVAVNGAALTKFKIVDSTFVALATDADAPTQPAWFDVQSGALADQGVVSIEDCYFTFRGSTAKSRRGGSVFGSSHASVSVRGNRFAIEGSNGSLAFSPNYPAFLYLAVQAYPHGFVVDGCSFRGSGADSDNSNWIGVQLNDVDFGVVTNCSFRNCARGVLVSETVGDTARGTRISTCQFYNLGSANQIGCYGVYFSVAPVDTIVEGCDFQYNGLTVITPQTAGYSLQGFVVSKCSFVDSRFGVSVRDAGGLSGGGGLDNVSDGITVSGCSFRATTDALPPPFVGVLSGIGILRCVWQGNQHAGYRDSTVSTNPLGLWLAGAAVVEAVIADNVFTDIQCDVAYSGNVSGVDGANPLILVNAGTHRLAVTGNVGTRLGTSLSGANAEHVTAIVLSSHTGLTGTALALDGVVVANNVFGISADGSRCTLFVAGDNGLPVKATARSLQIRGNSHSTVPSAASTSVAAFGFKISLDVTTPSRMLQICGNQWRVESSSTLAVDWISVRGTSSGVVLENFSISDNQFLLVGGVFTSSHGFFADSNVTVRNLGFLGNAAIAAGATTDPAMYTAFINIGDSNTRFAGPGDPGSSNAWTFNARIQRA